jgi:hypothetical protein
MSLVCTILAKEYWRKRSSKNVDEINYRTRYFIVNKSKTDVLIKYFFNLRLKTDVLIKYFINISTKYFPNIQIFGRQKLPRNSKIWKLLHYNGFKIFANYLIQFKL